MRDLSSNEIEIVGGDVSQSDVIQTNLAIIGIGAGAVFAGLTAPAWVPLH